jgi:hypothetical protein
MRQPFAPPRHVSTLQRKAQSDLAGAAADFQNLFAAQSPELLRDPADT